MQNLAYSGGYLDRASDRRSDPGWVAALMDSPATRLIPVWRGHCLVSGDPAAPVTALDASRGQQVREVGRPLFLGLDGDTGVFAADLSALDEAHAVAMTGAERIGDLRAFAATSESVTADGKEIVEARWFTRAELAQRATSGRPFGRVDSIDRHLLRSWLDQPDTPPGHA